MKHIWYRLLLVLSLTVVFLSLPIPLKSTASTLASTKQIAVADFFLQGVQATQKGNYAEALKVFTQAIQTNPAGSASAYANRCLVEIKLASYDAAIADCTQAIQRQSENPEAYLNRGLAHYRLGNYQAAIADNSHLIQLQPHDLRAYFNRGLAQVALGQPQAAIADFNQALQRLSHSDRSTLAEIHLERGLASFALADVQGATADFDQAVQLNPNSDRAYYNRGCLYGKQGNYIAAVQDFTQALKLNPDNPEAHLDRGVAQYSLGNDQEALNDLRQAAKFFQGQDKVIAYQDTINLIKQIQLSQEPVLT